MVINLLPQLSAEELKFLKKRKFLELSSIVLLVTAIVLVLCAFGYLALLSNEALLVDRKIAEAEAKVNQLAGRESLLRGFKLKMEFLTQILGKRPQFPSVLEKLYSLLPPGVSFSEVTLETKEITISGVAVSSFELGDFIGRFNDLKSLSEKEVEKVTLTSAVKDKTGVYRFSIKITLKETV